jgi:hypothetical protein
VVTSHNNPLVQFDELCRQYGRKIWEGCTGVHVGVLSALCSVLTGRQPSNVGVVTTPTAQVALRLAL